MISENTLDGNDKREHLNYPFISGEVHSALGRKLREGLSRDANEPNWFGLLSDRSAAIPAAFRFSPLG